MLVRQLCCANCQSSLGLYILHSTKPAREASQHFETVTQNCVIAKKKRQKKQMTYFEIGYVKNR
jgi:hypothetical protein